MKYFKIIVDGYVIGIGTGLDGDEITEQEYAEIYAAIQSRPTPPEGKDYRIKTDLTWEEYDLPPAPEPEPSTPEDQIAELESGLDEVVTILEGIV